MYDTPAEFKLTDAYITAHAPDPQRVKVLRKRVLLIMFAVMLFVLGVTWTFFYMGEIKGATWPEMIMISLLLLGMLPLFYWWSGREWKASGLLIYEGELIFRNPVTVRTLSGSLSATLLLTQNARGTRWLLAFSDRPSKRLNVPVADYPNLVNDLERAYARIR
jgi:hypothetical protein